jgi:hypothetical protein
MGNTCAIIYIGMRKPTPPILFVVFSRPDTTRTVFEAIRQAMPARLYVAADGPRGDRPDEIEKCEEVRRIATHVDWECEVYTLFGNENKGCGRQLTDAITWFFQHEEEGIILEDDCLPSLSFIPFCAELLDRYRNDSRIMSIGGNNLEVDEHRERAYSYSFTRLTYIWGWATWRRAWRLHDYNMKLYPEVHRKNYLRPMYDSFFERDLFEFVFERMYRGDDERTSRRNIWDYQWQFTCMANSGLTIVPSVNLVSNIGMGNNATSTTGNSPGNGLRCEDVIFPLSHPEFVMVDRSRERRTFELCHTSMKSRLKSRIKSMVPSRLVSVVRTLF